MTSKELNLKLIESFPEIKNAYLEETSWQEGDETGSHVVYADVFVPFIKMQIYNKNENILIEIFEYIERLLELDNEYTNEVIVLSVLESLLFDEETNPIDFIQFTRTKTMKTIMEIVQSLEK